MGIQGLLPLLKSIQKPCSLKQFAGKTVGVDAYGWLHRGTISCAIDLAQSKPTTKWLDFVMHRVRMLQHFGVVPYLVFDGDYLPSKSGTEKDRASRRRESKIKGLEFLKLGKTSQAQLELQKSIDVTPEMARQLIDELRKVNVQYIVAPYEADSQLAYLERQGVLDAILSEDSDLLVFGAHCLLTKLDQYGDCIMINRDDFTACREISLVGWSDADFRLMAILNGCDYLQGIDKLGLKTAYRLIRKHKTLDRIIRSVQFEGKIKVPPGYLDAFSKAEATFLYQWVYCPRSKCLVNFTEPASDVDLAQFPCIGKHVEPQLATGVATGNLHPHTKQPLLPLNASRSFSRAVFRGPSEMRTPELKKHKSIDTFFKPKRTPLAELDPNSFTPSPSQQRLLQSSPAPWSAEPIRRPSLLSQASSAVNVSTRPRPQRAATDVPKPSSKSPKRQRLCSDGYYASPTTVSNRVEAGSSKFFANSRSRQSTKRGSSASNDEFNLWSDDSVEKAMSQLQEVTEPPVSDKPRRKLSVFGDLNTPDRTPEDKVDTDETPFSAGLASEMRSLHTRFSYTDKEEKAQHAIEPDACEEPASSPGKDFKRKRSPALDGHIIPCSSPVAEQAKVQVSEIIITQDKTESTGKTDFQSSSRGSPQRLTDTQSSRSSKPCFSQGSEDLLIPDSEGGEDDDEEEEQSRRRRKSFPFSLSRFAFAG